MPKQDVNGALMAPEHAKDAKGRTDPRDMSDRELLEEIVASQRETQDLVVAFIEGMKTNPMMRMFAGKMGM